eukprot:TRINITY_DN41857_c0_g1_i1.p2 TRINITY_DN41857_c0_g1~~TRINITY_DN41857_c0_g1_i1.p2  ORF type:complete len:157 (-),score=12.08 TRINITY_DN41857_c0_g1_i1:63-533(-)
MLILSVKEKSQLKATRGRKRCQRCPMLQARRSKINDIKGNKEVSNKKGVIVAEGEDGRYKVKLETGVIINGLSNTQIRFCEDVEGDGQIEGVYAPRQKNYDTLQEQSRRIRSWYENHIAVRVFGTKWAEQFWNDVADARTWFNVGECRKNAGRMFE